jgi:hypothetical protein
MTWGRIFDRIDETELLDVVEKYMSGCDVKYPIQMKVCISLQEISHYPYFYEALFSFSQEKIPDKIKDYAKWIAKKKRALRKGKNIYFLGFLDDYKKLVERNNKLFMRKIEKNKKESIK